MTESVFFKKQRIFELFLKFKAFKCSFKKKNAKMKERMEN